MRTRVRRRPRPLDSSIAWKPVRDSHYVVASLQPGGEGRLEIFVEQAVLTRLQDISRSSPGYFMFGLLLGERFECPDTRSQYMLIGSLVAWQIRRGRAQTPSTDLAPSTSATRLL